MSVQVFTTIQTEAPDVVYHADVARFAQEGSDNTLTLRDAAGKVVAQYAPGCWAAAEILPDEPEPVVLRPGTVVRIPGIDVPFVVDKGLSTSGPHATLTFTTVDGLAWSEPRGANAAEPLPEWERELLEDQAQEHLEPVVSETTESYVSVATSITGSDADEVLKVLREGLNAARLDDPQALDLLRKAIRKHGLTALGLA